MCVIVVLASNGIILTKTTNDMRKALMNASIVKLFVLKLFFSKFILNIFILLPVA